jgi:transposase-like protein
MPRTYITKKKKVYNKDAMEKAIEAVKSGKLSIRQAADEFEVNKSTLHDTIKKKFKNPGKPGRKPIIDAEFENKIAQTLVEAARQGMGVSRRQLLRRVGVLCRKMKLHMKNPGKDWFQGFKKRHPNLTIRKAEKLTTTRARMLNPTILKNYFDDLNTLMTRLHLHDKPQNIWNCDETGKQFEHQPVRVLAEKGSKSVVGRTSPGRTNITIMACVSAKGKSMSPLLIVKGKTPRSLYGFNTTAAPAGSKWHFQTNGWMTDEIGEKWFTDIFLKECGEERPQLLILDGHSSHESLAILELAIQNDIHILSLPPHTTHALQPLDRSVFGPLNSAYNNACSEFLNQSTLHSVNKWSFPGLFANAWDNAVNEKNICSGFRSCGIYPLDPSAVDPHLLQPSKPSDTCMATVPESVSADSRVAISSASPTSANESLVSAVGPDSLYSSFFQRSSSHR